MTSTLTNRETASLLIFTALSLWFLTNQAVRATLGNLLKSILSRIILITASLTWVWIGTGVLILFKIGFWNFGMIKETILWATFSGLLVPFQGINEDDPARLYQRTIRRQFTLAILVSFYINLESFPLLVEIPLQLIIILTGLLQIVAQSKEKHRTTEKFYGCLLSLIGLAVISWVTSHVVLNHNILFNLGSLRSLALPFLMMLWVIPFGYIFSVYATYQWLLTRLNLKSHQSIDLRFYTVFKLVSVGGLRVRRIRRMGRLLSSKPAHASDHEQIDDLFSKLQDSLSDPSNWESRDFVWPERELFTEELRCETLEEYFDLIFPCYQILLRLADVARIAIGTESNEVDLAEGASKILSSQWETIDSVYSKISNFNHPPKEGERLDREFQSFASRLHDVFWLHSPLNTSIIENHRKSILSRSYLLEAERDLERFKTAYARIKGQHQSFPKTPEE